MTKNLQGILQELLQSWSNNSKIRVSPHPLYHLVLDTGSGLCGPIRVEAVPTRVQPPADPIMLDWLYRRFKTNGDGFPMRRVYGATGPKRWNVSGVT